MMRIGRKRKQAIAAWAATPCRLLKPQSSNSLDAFDYKLNFNFVPEIFLFFKLLVPWPAKFLATGWRYGLMLRLAQPKREGLSPYP